VNQAMTESALLCLVIQNCLFVHHFSTCRLNGGETTVQAQLKLRHGIPSHSYAAEKRPVLPLTLTSPQAHPLSLSPSDIPPLFTGQRSDSLSALRGSATWGLLSGQSLDAGIGQEEERRLGMVQEEKQKIGIGQPQWGRGDGVEGYAGVESVCGKAGDRVYMAILSEFCHQILLVLPICTYRFSDSQPNARPVVVHKFLAAKLMMMLLLRSVLGICMSIHGCTWKFNHDTALALPTACSIFVAHDKNNSYMNLQTASAARHNCIMQKHNKSHHRLSKTEVYGVMRAHGMCGSLCMHALEGAMIHDEPNVCQHTRVTPSPCTMCSKCSPALLQRNSTSLPCLFFSQNASASPSSASSASSSLTILACSPRTHLPHPLPLLLLPLLLL